MNETANLGIRRDLDITCNQNELFSMQNIQTELSVSAQASNPMSLPDGVSSDRAAAYFAGALQMRAAAQTKESLWWGAIINKYKLPKDTNVHIDFSDGGFYVLDPVAKA